MLLELSQARFIAEPVRAWLSESLPKSLWAIAEPYWARGVFDPIDLVATSIGGAMAFYLLTYLTRENGCVRG